MALAVRFPLAQNAMPFLVLAWSAAVFSRPSLWLIVLPALLPVIGLAPWSGWITFEELDILVLAVTAGGYARLAWPVQARLPARQATQLQSSRPFWGVWLLASLFAIATAIAIYRGITDAGGFSFGWYQGYHEPMNSVRVGKSIFLAILLVPLWQRASRQNPEQTQDLLSVGLMIGLAAAALTTLWERAAFTDLLNFSTDYRTTGMFWEMHVGGAALDGFLALTVPFAVREFVVARDSSRWGLAASVLALAAYACLTTFSRGVYLAVPVGMLVFFGLTARQGLPDFARHEQKSSSLHDQRPWQAMMVGVLLVAGYGVGAAWMFQSSGYRGMAALLGAVALMLPLVHVLRRFNIKQWLLGFVIGMLLILVMVAVDWLVPKGAYWAWGLAAIFTAAMMAVDWRAGHATSFAGPMAVGGFLATLASTALVARHWGLSPGLQHALPAVLALFAFCMAAGVRRNPLWPEALRWQATTAGAMGLVAAVIGVMGGGAYMSERFSTGSQDFGGRLGHWQLGRDMLSTPADWWLGKGTGRFPGNYFLNGSPMQIPGDYRLVQEGKNTFITLAGGSLINGWGEIFRVTQRVSPPSGSTLVTARVRTEKDVKLHFEICEKHLLYNQDCLISQANVKGSAGAWQNIEVPLNGKGVSRGAWYAPKLVAFSMAVESRGGIAQIDDVALTGADGEQQLANGGFSEGMAHWFFSSDRYHMPWHIKSMVMNVLFDQGIVGLTLWGLLLVGAIWRTSFGRARQNPLAPALAAGLAGFFVVGLFDSLLDVPRVAWLYYMLVLVALTLPSWRGKSTKP
ncbi:hypothetical protein [Rhodoferax sp. PAMC 29310]|uniref:hypothetical protein n=1 Tax=Rhodoferax sp. PAMC 29310 TaxID=2822760 RepID=UPI001B31F7A4|nr:hypothetical protein [Rhodoferax sp. PAMC 29310]